MSTQDRPLTPRQRIKVVEQRLGDLSWDLHDLAKKPDRWENADIENMARLSIELRELVIAAVGIGRKKRPMINIRWRTPGS